jgi:hypothetical protein
MGFSCHNHSGIQGQASSAIFKLVKKGNLTESFLHKKYITPGMSNFKQVVIEFLVSKPPPPIVVPRFKQKY